MKAVNRQSFVFESKIENMRSVEKFVDEICDYYNVSSTFFGNIIVAITEAVNNAIKHGNNNNPEKRVTINFEYKPNGLSFTIKDEGNGFNYTNIPDPTDPGSSLEDSHRGIFLMKNLADEIHFYNNGSSVELIFYITPVDQSISKLRINELLNITKEVSKRR
ncbi:MAG: ATP-binding protein [Bacteroidota bacterium]|nr:ATP-binding protein [Bacteroidota bacterium]